MIDEENVNQAIFEYADKKYGERSEELFRRYLNEFPEKEYFDSMSSVSSRLG